MERVASVRWQSPPPTSVDEELAAYADGSVWLVVRCSRDRSATIGTWSTTPSAADDAALRALGDVVVDLLEPRPAPEVAESSPVAATPVFRTRADLGKPAPAPIPAVIPIVRAPDDPGIDDDGPSDEFTEQIGTPKAQAGGWRGFWSRWGA